MKRNKGFTLIELLAVIVILAILALIAIPIVISIIKDSRENAHKRSIETYGRTIENVIAAWQSKNDGEPPKYISDYEVKTSGEKVVCDNEIKGIDSDDGIELTNCYVADSKGKQKSKDKYNIKNGKVTKVGEDSDSSNNTKTYKIGNKIKVSNEYYYVISDSDSNQDYVTALKENPLTVDEVNANKIGSDGINHVNRYTSSYQGIAYDWGDSNHTGGMQYYSSSICGWNGSNWTIDGCTTSYDSSDIKYVISAWAQANFTNDELKIVDGYEVRLVTKEELQPIGWKNCSSIETYCPKEEKTPNWLYNNSYYWTMSKWNDNTSNVWNVSSSGGLSGGSISSPNGTIRPVINVKKSAIQN